MSRVGTLLALCASKAPAIWIVLLFIAAAPVAAAPQTSLADLEDEVMCPICGTLLELSSSPQAERQRVFITRLVDAGASKEEVKDALVAEYGRGVLATPEGSGFALSAYLVPAIAFAVAVVGLGIGLRRWRRTGERDPDRPAPPDGDDAERLDADLARYDL